MSTAVADGQTGDRLPCGSAASSYVPVLATLALLVVMFAIGVVRYAGFATARSSSTSSSTTGSCSSSPSA